MKTLAMAIIITVAGLNSGASAADKSGHYMILGAGADSCGEWAKERRTGDWYADGGWVLGFVSSYNLFVWRDQNVAKNIDSEGIAAWVDGYCAAHPLNNISDASERLIIVLRAKANGVSMPNEYGP